MTDAHCLLRLNCLSGVETELMFGISAELLHDYASLRDRYNALEKLIAKLWCEFTVFAVSLRVIRTKKSDDELLQKYETN